MADSTNNTNSTEIATAEQYAAMKFAGNPNIWKQIPNNVEFTKNALCDVVNLRIASRVIGKDDLEVEKMVQNKNLTDEDWVDVIENLTNTAERYKFYASICESASLRLICGMTRIELSKTH